MLWLFNRNGSSPLSRGIRHPNHRRQARLLDHPRSRGEYSGAGATALSRAGSSPLSRGIRLEVLRRNRAAGIIPALAGNTPPVGKSPTITTDHPRSRGEYAVTSPSPERVSGSSPLSRGIRADLLQRALPERIIPALAGNTGTTTCGVSPGWDHPRSRGEYWEALWNNVLAFGSSPLSRGILEVRPSGGASVRIIPALAGNTITDYGLSPNNRDHPRSRGEYMSEPLRLPIPWWIIPALAGNTAGDGGMYTGSRDHPRSRGEYFHDVAVIEDDPGSSPLSRGILGLNVEDGWDGGIIPALAGNTHDVTGGMVVDADHPRSRGEYHRRGGAVQAGSGSSPLSRGIPPSQVRELLARPDHPRSRGEYLGLL